MRVARSRADGSTAGQSYDGDVRSIKAAEVLGVGDDSLGLDDECSRIVINEVFEGLDSEGARDVPVSVGPLDLAIVDCEVLCTGVGDWDNDCTQSTRVAAINGTVEGEGDGLRETLENLEGTWAAELDLLACKKAI